MRAAGISYANELLTAGAAPRRASELPCNPASEEVFAAARAKVVKSARGQTAPLKSIELIQVATEKPFAEGLALERAAFLELMAADQSKAMIHAFFSERQVGKLVKIKGVMPRALEKLGVVGGGTMGAGIATSALFAGLDVTLLEQDAESAERAQTSVLKLLQGAVKRGKLSEQAFTHIQTEKFRTTVDYAGFADADLVIEAVFESFEVKRAVFTQLDTVCKPGAILASNTSYLDLNAIADMTSRPADVLGLHFFSPAHIMKLLEVVEGEKTAPDVLATGFALAKTAWESCSAGRSV